MIYSCQRLTDFPLRRRQYGKDLRKFPVYDHTTGKNWVSFDPRSQTLSGEDSTWMVDRLEIPRVVDFFFFLFDYTIELFGCFKTLALFCQGSVKIKLSLLSVHCYTTFMLSSK